MFDLNREVWEGWRPIDFIERLTPEIDIIMAGDSWRKPFVTKSELREYIIEHQP